MLRAPCVAGARSPTRDPQQRAIGMRPDPRPRLPFQANLLRFRAFPRRSGWRDYTASPSNTALHRSWMLAERAFGQLASV